MWIRHEVSFTGSLVRKTGMQPCLSSQGAVLIYSSSLFHWLAPCIHGILADLLQFLEREKYDVHGMTLPWQRHKDDYLQSACRPIRSDRN